MWVGTTPKLITTRKRINSVGKYLGFLEARIFMDPVLRSFAESSKSHWTFFLRFARSKESSPADTIQADSIFGFRLSCMRSWR